MEKEIDFLKGARPTLLLHACCGPCSLSVIETLKPFFDLTIYFYNPNIYPEEEYIRRKEELKSYAKKEDLKYLEGDYDARSYEEAIKGLEKERERGLRCDQCFKLRLTKTRDLGEFLGFEYFTTTLTVSPHKNSQIINQIGLGLESENIKWLASDFKKGNGFLKGLRKAHDLGMYQQDYCGCQYSIRKKGE